MVYNSMTKCFTERRKYQIGDFEYLLDDDDRTAWISKGHTAGARRYTLPESVEIEGVAYTITSVECMAYSTSRDANLEEIVFPDSYEYFGEYTFGQAPLKRVRLGKGFRYYAYWSLKGAAEDVIVEIDSENPSLKMSEDGHMVLTKDGKILVYLIHDVEDVVVPAGIESIAGCAISCKNRLKSIHLPPSLKCIAIDGMIQNHRLGSLVFPEGVAKIGHQALWDCGALESVDLPSTLTAIDSDTFLDDKRLKSLILRAPFVVTVRLVGADRAEEFPLETCRLVVPKALVSAYRDHPFWGRFRHIGFDPDLF